MSAFVKACPVPPFICNTVFSRIIHCETFESWKNSENVWHIRVTGGPGSGKTTLSTLVVDELKRVPGSTVATIFMTPRVKHDESYMLLDILHSIRSQLDVQSSSRDVCASQKILQDRESLRTSICTLLSTLPLPFLVVDDLDQCGYKIAQLLEEELVSYQAHGLRIMTTSRVARYNEEKWQCNAPFDHTIASEFDVWVCKMCYDIAEQAEEPERGKIRAGLYTFCNSCKDVGAAQDICFYRHESPTLCRPFDYAEMDLSKMFCVEHREDISYFGIWMIQNEHGKIYPKISGKLEPDESWPPLTPIGRALSTKPVDWMGHIMYRAEGNLTLAKLRLGEICERDSLSITEGIKDRLPSKIVSIFDAAIVSVQNQAEDTTMLGMSAIKAITQSLDGMSIANLLEVLDAAVARYRLEPVTRQEVLYASRGLLITKWGFRGGQQQEFVKAYHEDFWRYASERYNEDLEAFKL